MGCDDNHRRPRWATTHRQPPPLRSPQRVIRCARWRGTAHRPLLRPRGSARPNVRLQLRVDDQWGSQDGHRIAPWRHRQADPMGTALRARVARPARRRFGSLRLGPPSGAAAAPPRQPARAGWQIRHGFCPRLRRHGRPSGDLLEAAQAARAEPRPGVDHADLDARALYFRAPPKIVAHRVPSSFNRASRSSAPCKI